jgi:hypothetical protein
LNTDGILLAIVERKLEEIEEGYNSRRLCFSLARKTLASKSRIYNRVEGTFSFARAWM